MRENICTQLRTNNGSQSSKQILLASIIVGAILITISPAPAAFAQPPSISASVSSAPTQKAAETANLRQTKSIQQGAPMPKHASGSFEVKVIPQKPDSKEAESANIGRFSLDKQFHGDLEGTSTGEMLGAMTEVKGSAGYVAMERVRGTLDGRNGTFVLQHSGTMTRNVPIMTVTVVPDSGTGDLVGISGNMEIKIEDSKHFYEFEYQLAQ